MLGKICDAGKGVGVIAGNDGNIYPFHMTAFIGTILPSAGDIVSFSVEDGRAVKIDTEKFANEPSPIMNLLKKMFRAIGNWRVNRANKELKLKPALTPVNVVSMPRPRYHCPLNDGRSDNERRSV